MTTKREDPELRKTWKIIEQHGLWWAYEGELPPLEAFQTHGRSNHLPILGPYPSRIVAEALLRRIPGSCGAEGWRLAR